MFGPHLTASHADRFSIPPGNPPHYLLARINYEAEHAHSAAVHFQFAPADYLRQLLTGSPGVGIRLSDPL